MSPRPNLPYVLGIAGLVPFVVFALPNQYFLGDLFVNSEWAIATYAAVILSFLAGARWGAELATSPDATGKATLIASMAPPILAWISVLLVYSGEVRFGLSLLLAGLLVQLTWDIIASRPLPAWYPRLRMFLSAVAIACMGIALFTFEESPFLDGEFIFEQLRNCQFQCTETTQTEP